ncbi:TPA: hypothetical protein KPG21_004083 [Clostridioides difficile]|uniref:hypothetical protein n=1 Tax=Clostridioides difficile TaxID=1496 RepID=UPI000945C97F|nr:hypothetical protein [Clostridioides difficile]MBY2561145.1 hypothetical protein [Clostridioides difficile]HBG1029198.1 hypothetical protein [Clostridioides difficile]HBG1718697.1 hypothetical protein [Clostridioides difficile]HBG2118054.1 hypothetical protein [Clostridioides difficile]HBG2167573.1 hypothetical protein [Clostridioides difficile]
MAKIWMDAHEVLSKTMDLEDMFELNLREAKNKNKGKELKRVRREGKAIRCFNILTREFKIFDSAKEASMYLNFSAGYISYLAKKDVASSNGWKARYVKEVANGISKCRASN